jgi:haloalkane dehalogenase
MDIGHFHLVVHDWGGAIGMGVATRLQARVRSIVILNSAAFLSKQMPLRIALCRTKIGSLAIRYLNVFAKAATIMATKTPLAPDVKYGYLYPYYSPQHRIAIDRFVQDIPMNESHPTYDVLKNIQEQLLVLAEKPCMIAWGMHDFCFTSKFLNIWQKFFPNAECYQLKDAGHYVLEDAKEEILPIIRRFIVKNTLH